MKFETGNLVKISEQSDSLFAGHPGVIEMPWDNEGKIKYLVRSNRTGKCDWVDEEDLTPIKLKAHILVTILMTINLIALIIALGNSIIAKDVSLFWVCSVWAIISLVAIEYKIKDLR